MLDNISDNAHIYILSFNSVEFQLEDLASNLFKFNKPLTYICASIDHEYPYSLSAVLVMVAYIISNYLFQFCFPDQFCFHPLVLLHMIVIFN